MNCFTAQVKSLKMTNKGDVAVLMRGVPNMNTNISAWCRLRHTPLCGINILLLYEGTYNVSYSPLKIKWQISENKSNENIFMRF